MGNLVKIKRGALFIISIVLVLLFNPTLSSADENEIIQIVKDFISSYNIDGISGHKILASTPGRCIVLTPGASTPGRCIVG